MLDFSRYEALTFDCYGTLVDWERGILDALLPLARRHGIRVEEERLLELYGRAESQAESGPYRPYRDVLADTVRGIGRELGFEPTGAEAGRLAGSLPDWPPFPDSPPALEALGERYRLGIVSNVDDDLFERTRRALGVEFDLVVTAQQVRSYKPDLRHFERALERLDLEPTRVLHVAQSLYHDIGPAAEAGLDTVHVDRRSEQSGPGATPTATARARPDLVVGDLDELLRTMGLD